MRQKLKKRVKEWELFLWAYVVIYKYWVPYCLPCQDFLYFICLHHRDIIEGLYRYYVTFMVYCFIVKPCNLNTAEGSNAGTLRICFKKQIIIQRCCPDITKRSRQRISWGKLEAVTGVAHCPTCCSSKRWVCVFVSLGIRVMRMISTPTTFLWIISVVQLKRVGRYDF